MGSKSDLEGDQYMSTLRRQALGVLAYWNNKMEGFDDMGVLVLELRVQAPAKTGGDFRVIAKARDESGNLIVAFGNGADFQSALADLKIRSETRGIVWREDKPYTPGGGGAQ